MARERAAAADQALSAARAARVTADLNLERQRALEKKGLTSTRFVELAALEAAQRIAEVDRAVAALNAAGHEQSSLDQERLRTDADGATRVDEAWAAHASAASDLAKARADLTRLQRQSGVIAARRNSERQAITVSLYPAPSRRIDAAPLGRTAADRDAGSATPHRQGRNSPPIWPRPSWSGLT